MHFFRPLEPTNSFIYITLIVTENSITINFYQFPKVSKNDFHFSFTNFYG